MNEIVAATRQEVLCNLLKRAADELQRVLVGDAIAEFQLQTILHSVRNQLERMVLLSAERRHNRVRIVTSEVATKDWYFALATLEQVATALDCATIRTAYVIVVTYILSGLSFVKWFVGNVARRRRCTCSLIVSRHCHSRQPQFDIT